MAQSSPSAEYRALVNCTEKLVLGIQNDLHKVSIKLFANGLITEIPQDSSNRKEKAGELYMTVIRRVECFPENFATLVAVLKETLSLQKLGELLVHECDKIKMEDLQTSLQRSEIEKSFNDSGYGTPSSSPHHEKITYIGSETLTEKDRERLVARLEDESDRMKFRFAILVDRVKGSLENQNITCKDLSVLVGVYRKKLLSLTKQQETISDLFLELDEYWSFFDYELVCLFLERHCQELIPELSKYISAFKEFCKKRLCELPPDVFAKKGDKNNLYVKTDCIFTIRLEEVKKMEIKLSRLLGTELCLLNVEEGCLKLTFYPLCDISTPLTHKQIEELTELGVRHLYSDSMEYFNKPDVPSSTSLQYPSSDSSKRSLQKRFFPKTSVSGGGPIHRVEGTRKTKSWYDSTTRETETMIKYLSDEFNELGQEPKIFVREQHFEGLGREGIGQERRAKGYHDQDYFNPRLANVMPWRGVGPPHPFQDADTYPGEDPDASQDTPMETTETPCDEDVRDIEMSVSYQEDIFSGSI